VEAGDAMQRLQTRTFERFEC